MNVHKCVQSEKRDSLSAVYECVSSSFYISDFFFKVYSLNMKNLKL